jgi:hypothetical protein
MYTTKAKIEAWLGKTLSQTEAQVNNIIEGIDEYIDGYTNRTFSTMEGTKYFDGTDKVFVIIDDLLELDEVELGDRFGDGLEDITEDVKPYPNQTPHTQLLYKQGRITDGFQNVKVTGTWGYAEDVPKDIEFASTVLSAGALTQVKGAKQSERIGNYQVSYGQDSITDYTRALDILKKYRRYYL